MKNILSLRTLLTVSFLFLISTSFALTRFWRGTGANSNWNNNNNWSASSGGGTGVSFPTGSDIAIFDGGGNTACTINVSSAAGTLTVTSGYTNTITQNNGFTFNIGTGGASLGGGTFVGGNSTIGCLGSFTISGMAFTSTSGNLALIGNYTLSSGSFTDNGGTVLFSSTATITGSSTFYNLTVTSPVMSAATYTIPGGTVLTVANTFIIGATNAITLNTGEIDVQGNITVTNTNSGGGGSALLKINGTGSQTLTGSGVANTGKLPKVEINKASGTLTLASIISLANDWTYVSGTISFSSGTPMVDACASLNMDCQGSGSTMAFYDLTMYGGTTTLTGNMGIAHDLAINASQTLNGSSYTIALDGKWTNNGTFTSATSTVQFQGTALQTINKSSTESFYNLIMNKPSGRLLLNTPVTIANSVTFTEGIIKAGSTTNFNVADNATASGGNDSAFVYGYYKKTGNEAFTFALGDTSVSTDGYHPLSIGVPSSASDAYTARYFNAVQTQGGARDSILNYTSTCEHWHLNRDAGSSNVTVKLGWNTTSCNIDSLNDLRVAYWNGSKWKDKGGSYTGNTSIGDVITSSAQNAFGYFIIAKKYSDAFAGADVTICIGDSTHLSGSTGTSYNWTPSTGLSCTNCYNPYAKPSATTTYTYTVTYPSGWQSSDNLTVIVSGTPLATHVGCTPDTFNTIESDVWFTFSIDSLYSSIIRVKNFSDTTENHIKGMTLYKGTCSSMMSETASFTYNYADSTIILSGLFLDSISNYYLKLSNDVRDVHASKPFSICVNKAAKVQFYFCDSQPSCPELVKNGNFEGYNFCPNVIGNIDIDTLMSDLQCWGRSWGYDTISHTYWANESTPEYYNSCATDPSMDVPTNSEGSQADHSTGQAYAGIMAYAVDETHNNITEYIQQTLYYPMLQGASYDCEFYASLSDNSNLAVDRLGMLISNGVAYQPYYNWQNTPRSCVINTLKYGASNPQIQRTLGSPITNKSGWTKISGTYLAHGGEQNLTVGSFNWDASAMPTGITVSGILQWGTTGRSYYFIDDVSIKLVKAIPNQDTTICSGHGVQLFAGAYDSFAWSPSTGLSCSNCATPFASPLVTTTYHVTLTQGTCTYYDSIKITVNPSPYVHILDTYWMLDSSATTTAYMICQPKWGNPPNPPCSHYASPIIPNSKYYWHFDTGLGTLVYGGDTLDNFIEINWTGSASTYLRLLVVDTLTGCSDIDSVLIRGCCMSGLVDTNTINIPLGGYASVIFAGNIVRGKNIWVNGTLIIDKNMRFEGDTIILGSNSKIIMADSITLTLTLDLTTGNRTYVHSCEYMWDGIYAENLLDSIFIIDGVTIEDAINGVVIKNDNYYKILGISDSYPIKFNKNLRSVQISNFSNPSTGVIGSSVFENYQNVVPGFTYPGGNLRPPLDYQSAYSGVEITDVDTILVGKSGSLQYNVFDSLRVGVKSVNTNYTVVSNNIFQNIIYINSGCVFGNCVEGIAVYGSGTSGVFKTLYVGITPTGRGNIFDNCMMGVKTEQNLSLVCTQNDFAMTTPGLMFSPGNNPGTAVYVNDVRAGLVVVSANNISKFTTAIQTRYIDSSQVVIYYNNIINDVSNVAYSRGIAMQDAVTAASSHAIVTYNTISNVQTGILAQNLHGDNPNFLDRVSISQNKIIFANAQVPASGFVYGIRLQNCSYVVNQADTVYRTTNSPSGDKIRLFGISQEKCDHVFTFSNYFQKLGTGMRFFDYNKPTVYRCNTMDHCQYGVYEDRSEIGTQGSSSSATDNQWLNTYGSSSDIRFKPVIDQPDWYTQAGVPYLPDFQALAITNFSGASASSTCVEVYSGVHKQQLMAPIAKDSIVYPDYQYYNEAAAAQSTYRELMMDTTLLDQSTYNDILLTGFRDSMASVDLGKIYEVGKLLYEGDVAGAVTAYNGISGVDVYESQHKIVYGIFLETVALGNYRLNSDQRSILMDVAQQNPLDYGRAVYEARAILDTNFDDDGFGSALRLGRPETKIPGKQILSVRQGENQYRLYPNPNNGTMQLEYRIKDGEEGQMVIFDLTGRSINSYKLHSNTTILRINEQELKNAVYFYRIIVNDQVVKTDKLVIIK